MESAEIKEKVLLALAEIRPFLAADGGDISLVSIEDDRIVSVQLHGACVGCSVNQTVSYTHLTLPTISSV